MSDVLRRALTALRWAISDGTAAARFRTVLLSLILAVSAVGMFWAAATSPAWAVLPFVAMIFSAVGLFTSSESEFVEDIASRTTETFVKVEDLDLIVVLTTIGSGQLHRQYELDRDSIVVRPSTNPRVEITEYDIRRTYRNAYGWMTSLSRESRTSVVIWIDRESMSGRNR